MLQFKQELEHNICNLQNLKKKKKSKNKNKEHLKIWFLYILSLCEHVAPYSITAIISYICVWVTFSFASYKLTVLFYQFSKSCLQSRWFKTFIYLDVIVSSVDLSFRQLSESLILVQLFTRLTVLDYRNFLTTDRWWFGNK